MWKWLPAIMVAGAGIAVAASPYAYVDAKLCSACHAKISQTYSKTGMARSFYKPDAQHEVEDFTKGNPFYQQASATGYSMLRAEGKYCQRRWRIGYNGSETDVEELPIDYVMGSGNPVRTYLSKTHVAHSSNCHSPGIRKTAAIGE